MHLSNSQQAVVAAFRQFLKSDEQVFMLKGAAGTGKTTLVAEFLAILDAHKREYSLLAPTGRAAHILGGKTGRVASTIHKAIYSVTNLQSTSQHKEDEDDGGLHLRFALHSNNASMSHVYIVDEASMVSDNYSESEAFFFGSGYLLSDLFEYARGRKILFIGDYAQLPPVGMNFSPALNREYLQEKFGSKVCEMMLTEVMRQSANGVMLANATRLRNSIDSKTFIEFKLDSGTDSSAEEVDLLQPYYQLSEDKPSVRAAVITHSNKQALDYNLRIRRHYYGADAQRLRAGDLLMISRNNYNHEQELFNGNIVRVEACQPDEDIIRRKVRIKVNKERIEEVELRFRKATIKFAGTNGVAELNVMLLDNFLDDPSGSVGNLLARALIVDFHNCLPKEIKSKMSEIRQDMKQNKQTYEPETEMYLYLLRTDPFYNAVICKYGYAMTCHKAQGGEWENVFVDMSRSGGTANEDYFRWAYTALTRASQKVWHFRAPNFNYTSNLVVAEIQHSPKIKVSTYTNGSNFCETRFARIQLRAAELGLTVTDNLSKAYQHLISFADNQGNYATFHLWYNATGYNGKEEVLSSTSEELTELSRPIIEASYAPDVVPFSAPERPFAEKLVAFIRSQLSELGIQLLNITQEAYQDVFHLKTDGLAQVGLTYTDKGNYTYMRLASTLGQHDNKLQELRKRVKYYVRIY